MRNQKFLAPDGTLLTAGKSGKTPPGQIIGKDNGGGKDKGPGKDKGNEKFQYFYHPDHLGSTSYITDASGEVYQHLEYFAFGGTFVQEHANTKRTPYKFNGKELDEETGLYYYGARYYDAKSSVWLSVDPLASDYPSWSSYNYTMGNPINLIDPTGKGPEDWIGKEDGSIEWDDKVTSADDADLKSGETYLGKNVLVGTHNRDESGNEPINSARFDLYLESNKEGPTATIYGNTVPDDATVSQDRYGNSLPEGTPKYGTLAEGVYTARYENYNGDGALLIGEGLGLPTLNGNQNNPDNYVNGKLKPVSQQVVSEIFFHKGNYARESLHTSSGSPISAGCQTGGCGLGTLPKYRNFIQKAKGFNGFYYLR